MIGTWAVACCRRIMRHTSSPSIPGRFRSSSTRSAPRRTPSRPCFPRPRDLDPRSPRARAGNVIASAMSGSSSMTSTRLRSGGRRGGARGVRSGMVRTVPRALRGDGGCLCASTTKTTSSAMLVAWSAMRSRLRRPGSRPWRARWRPVRHHEGEQVRGGSGPSDGPPVVPLHDVAGSSRRARTNASRPRGSWAPRSPPCAAGRSIGLQRSAAATLIACSRCSPPGPRSARGR